MHINSTHAISEFAYVAVCSYVTLIRDLHICSIIVKICATYVLHISIFTPHTQRERGKVIGCGVHIYMFVNEKNI